MSDQGRVAALREVLAKHRLVGSSAWDAKCACGNTDDHTEHLADVLASAPERAEDDLRTREHLAWLMYCYAEGYTAPADRAVLTNWMSESDESLLPEDRRTKHSLLAMADEVLAALNEPDDREAARCYTCNGWNPVSGLPMRETVGMVCPTCGTDYSVQGARPVTNVTAPGARALDDIAAERARVVAGPYGPHHDDEHGIGHLGRQVINRLAPRQIPRDKHYFLPQFLYPWTRREVWVQVGQFAVAAIELIDARAAALREGDRETGEEA